ncbi:hypothetical protein HW115_18915 [Verrucomicrobiaceae bacterium N1E253]|uniref:Uncharacterized protein n=1 Tax=Oceaniferula marina TaxID=2748318 RepID=A0A851GRP9_9BACT|nr:hypothetical protein [Oceaniferula marina]NWK57697.1 hypothetical protein [Oceaniferula marina]
MRPKWAFQLLPNTPHVLGKGFRVDHDTQAIEDEVNSVLQCKFNFHGISKVVIRLGPKEGDKDYVESHGVAQKLYSDFDVHEYKDLEKNEKIQYMRGIIFEVLDWLYDNFDDAQCFRAAKEKLSEQVAAPDS